MVMLNFKTTTGEYVAVNPKSISFVKEHHQCTHVVMVNDETLSIGMPYLEVVGMIRGAHE